MPALDPTAFVLVLARVAGLVLAAPVFGHLLVPVRVRVGIVALLAAVLATALPPVPAPATMSALALAVGIESIVGVLLGLVAQFVLVGVQLGGQLAGTQMGFGMASLIDPGSSAHVTIVSEWQQLVALAVFLALDVHHLLIRALLASFRSTPPGAAVLSAGGVQVLLALAGDVFATGVRIAAPVIVVLVLANLALGVLARTIPQLNVFVVGFPLNVGVGLMALGISLPFTVRLLAARFAALEPGLATLVARLAHG
jgi:flagellar biosynthetic protein FliR